MTASSSISTPAIDWFALAPLLILLGAASICLLSAVLVPQRAKRPFAAFVSGGAYLGAFVVAAVLYADSKHGHGVIADAIRRDIQATDIP